MKPGIVLQELEQLAGRFGWEIRYEKGDFQSGFCQMEQQRLIIIHKTASTAERINYIAKVLAQEDLDSIFLLPQVRTIIDNQHIDNG